jgi:crotonobetainyl-CoA:carnitine CoA-transferase CaiB-like acyl-CoA transferase
MLGEHTEQVLADLLGRSPAQIAQLREAQVI